MRKRGNSINGSSGNLLLDTLCNALGGILFIALLVVMLAHQVPVLDPNTPSRTLSEIDLNKLEVELRSLPSQSALREQLNSYLAALEEYQITDLKPVPTDLDQETLLKKRQRLSAMPAPREVPTTSYRVPAIHQAANLSDAYIVLFKGGKVFASPFSAELLNHKSTKLSNQLHFNLDQRGVVEIEPVGEGMNVDQALKVLYQAIRTKTVIANECKLYLYAYPDGVEDLQSYRKQAMRRVPHAIWHGMAEGTKPNLVFTNEAQSNMILGF
jgi:hypothetical protein